LYDNVTDKDNANIEPEFRHAYIGEYVHFTCTDGYNITWYYERSSDIPDSDPISFGHTLNLRNLKSYNTGQYYCVGEQVDGAGYFLSQAFLYVYGKLAR